MRLRYVLLAALAMAGAGQGWKTAEAGPPRQRFYEVATSDARSYSAWVNDAIAKLSGDDEGDQNKAANQLASVIIYPPLRPKVLAALEPHLNSNNSQFRLFCVKAYGHWATEAEATKLADVVANPADPPKMSGVEPCWVAAVAALINLDSKAAGDAMESRTDNFFFRTGMASSLTTLTELNDQSQPAAYGMLKQLDPANQIVKLSVPDAEDLLRSDSAKDRTKGAECLAHAVVDGPDRSDVIALLKPHVMGSNGHARLPFVMAFAHWATAGDVPTLKGIVGYPATVTGISGHEDCWAAATVGLARLDPAAAQDAVRSREGAFFYTESLRRCLEPVAQGNGPMASTAAWLLGQITSTDGPLPLPPDFPSVKPMPAAPTDSTDGHQHA